MTSRVLITNQPASRCPSLSVLNIAAAAAGRCGVAAKYDWVTRFKLDLISLSVLHSVLGLSVSCSAFVLCLCVSVCVVGL